MAASTELSFNKKVGLFKMFVSSLFARKQKYLVVDGSHKNTFYMTNIDHELVPIYKPDIENTLAKVTIIDEQLSQIVYEAYPIFEKVIAEIELRLFTSCMNKLMTIVDKTRYPDLFLDKDALQLRMRMPEGTKVEYVYTKDGKIKRDKETGLPKFKMYYPDESSVDIAGDKFARVGDSIEVIVGVILPYDSPEFYDAIINKFNSFTEHKEDVEVTIPSVSAKDNVVLIDLELNNTEKGYKTKFRFPIQDGTNVVSYREYLSKKKLPWKYNLVIQYKQSTDCAKVSVVYSDDWIKGQIIMPGSLWFPFKMK